MDPALSVATPERVRVDLPIAGIGSRSIAYLIDLAIVFGGLLVLWFAFSLVIAEMWRGLVGLSGVERAIAGLVLFAAIWGYWAGFETLWLGQTPGKRAMRIRVVKSDGSPAGVFEIAVRNLMRVVDFLPACYPVGMIAMLVDARHRRLGDLLAGTMLVRDEQIDLQRYAAASAARLSPQDLEVVTAFLARFDALDPHAQRTLGAQLVAKHGGPADADVRAFLTALSKGA